ncbi:helix-turn-helix domain-containing protein [Enterococcus sp. AZ163]|uniref:helix-turn-helix domain-containing protein n=1 Tax=Enterococcus sp. AZ163 TaxID=2774638 RepID=UPI003D2E1B97
MDGTITYQSLAELARELGITRQTLYNRLNEHEIDHRTLTFTQDQLRLLQQRKAPINRTSLTPKQKHQAELAAQKETYEKMLATLKEQHEKSLLAAQNTYEKSLEKQQKHLEFLSRFEKRLYDDKLNAAEKEFKENTVKLEGESAKLRDQLKEMESERNQLLQNLNQLTSALQQIQSKPKRYPRNSRY